MRRYRLFMETRENKETSYQYIIVEFDREIPNVFAYGDFDTLNQMVHLLNNRFPTDDGAIKES